MERVTNLDELLLGLLGSKDLVDRWWNSENTYFGGDTPQQIFIETPNKVVAYIQQHCYGEYS